MAGQNFTGRGLWTPELSNVYVTPPSAVFAWDDTSQTWKTGKAAWTWDPDVSAWVMIWSSLASSPVSPAAAYSDTPTQVTISWTLPSPNIVDYWEIIRSADGATIGTVPATTTSIIDSNPIARNNSYSVRGRVGVFVGAAATNVLNLANLPASLTATYSNPNVHLVAPEPSYGAPDFYRLYIDDRVTPRGGAVGQPDGPFVVTDVAAAGGALAYDHDLTTTLGGGLAGYWFGHQVRYYLTTVLSGTLASSDTFPTSIVADVDIPALAPLSVTINRRTAGLGTVVDLSWVFPQGQSGPWDIQKSLDNSTWTNVATGFTGGNTISTTGGPPLWMRVRNNPGWAGGASAYVTVGSV